MTIALSALIIFHISINKTSPGLSIQTLLLSILRTCVLHAVLQSYRFFGMCDNILPLYMSDKIQHLIKVLTMKFLTAVTEISVWHYSAWNFPWLVLGCFVFNSVKRMWLHSNSPFILRAERWVGQNTKFSELCCCWLEWGCFSVSVNNRGECWKIREEEALSYHMDVDWTL